MQSNYDRLFQQLSGLIDDREVYQSLDDHLRHRVDSLLTYNSKQSPSRTINQLSCNDFQNLFSKNDISYTQPYCERIALRETTNSNNAKRKHTLNSSGKITAKKVETSAFDEEKRGERGNFSKNKSLNKTKVNNKSNRDLIRYNMHTSKSKSKDKDKILRKGPESSSKKMISHFIQRNIDNVSPINKAERQSKKQFNNTNTKTEKKSSVNIRPTASEQSSMLFHPKRTINSKLCESREIIKKLATIQTDHSRHSFSGSKNPSKEKRCIKASNDKQLTVMEAITRKQQMLNIERRQSQSQIKALQDLIDKERNRLDMTNINIGKLNSEITKKQLHERGCSQQIKISRKKSQNFISQSRQLSNHIIQVNKSRDSITASIEEERYLINMYLTVIEEIKSQLKIQQSQKIDLIKRLVTVKNTEKMCMEKYLSKEAVSDNIFRGMSQSMKKWV